MAFEGGKVPADVGSLRLSEGCRHTDTLGRKEDGYVGGNGGRVVVHA